MQGVEISYYNILSALDFFYIALHWCKNVSCSEFAEKENPKCNFIGESITIFLMRIRLDTT